MHSVLLTLLAVVTQQQARVNADIVPTTVPLSIRYTGGGYKDRLFKYRLYVPASATVEKPAPLIIWLHGLSHAGNDNTAQLADMDPLLLPGGPSVNHGHFVLAPQCPADNSRWTMFGRRKDADDMVNVVAKMLEQTLADYPVDPDRVTIIGLSSGGSGCWAFAERHPQYLAAAAPQASGGIDMVRLAQAKEVPIWAFHSVNDSAAPIGNIRSAVYNLKAAGGNVHLTEIPASRSRNLAYVGHDCWTAAFEDYHLLDWLTKQRRGHSTWWNAPGSVSFAGQVEYATRKWNWWQMALQLAVPTVLVIAIWTIVQHRRRVAGPPRPELGAEGGIRVPLRTKNEERATMSRLMVRVHCELTRRITIGHEVGFSKSRNPDPESRALIHA